MSSLRRPRLLVVDDEPSIRFAMKEFLSTDFEVDCAAEREEGEALVVCIEYAAIIVDIRLTGSESREGLEIIRTARERSLATRIIVLSAYSSPELDAAARRFGADLIIRKPRPLPDIARDIFELLGVSR